MTHVRSRVTRALKLADETGDAAWLRFAVVGSGQAGIELAGEIAELVGTRRARIALLLPDVPEHGRRGAVRDLVERGVDVWLRARVVGADDEGLEIDGALRMPARTVMWAPPTQGDPSPSDKDLLPMRRLRTTRRRA
jgi:NADH dehydrogenase FAD-containing subunit